MRTKLQNFLIRLGLGIGMLYIVALAVLYQFDGRVFDLPNHKLLISDGGFHFYGKTITFEFLADEQMKELAE